MKRKLLVIDDDVRLRGMIREYFEELGYEVILAEEGTEGVALAHVEKPDLIMLDVNMPNMHGFQVIKMLKDDPNSRDIPVIMMSALAIRPKDVEAGFSLGAENYLLKPFALGELKTKIEALLSRKKTD